MSNSVTERFLKKLKNASVLALTVTLAALTFAGCDGTGSMSAVSGTGAAEDMKYTVANPLSIEDVREGNGAEFDYHYIKISGLKDKETERKVNDRIKAVYDGLRVQDIPPYRGIKERIPEDFVLRNESVYANVAGNFNNILSVVFNKYASYQDPDSMGYEKDPKYYDSTRYYSETETLNFDLNTGREIRLKDLFRDDADPMKLINDRMSSFLTANYSDDEGYYIGTYGEVKQVEAFKGLSEDQVFAVYPYGIAFVFDYRTPQFETGGIAASPVLYYSEFSGSLAVAERFYREDKNIYESEAPSVKSFAVEFVRNDIAGNSYTDGDTVTVYRSWSYSSQLPEEMKAKLEKMCEVDRSGVDELKEACGRLPAGKDGSPGNRCAYEVMVYGEKVGPYYNICRNTNIYMPESGTMSSEYHCYDGEMRELKLEDIFRKDVDYRSVLEQAIRKTSKEPVDLSVVSGFNLQTDALLIAVSGPEAPNRSGSMNLFIPYGDIGCDNLNIFD